MAEGFKEAVFFRYLPNLILFPHLDVKCTTVFEDNAGALHSVNHQVTTPNSEHIIPSRAYRERRFLGSSCIHRWACSTRTFSPNRCISQGGILRAPQHRDENVFKVYNWYQVEQYQVEQYQVCIFMFLPVLFFVCSVTVVRFWVNLICSCFLLLPVGV